MGRFHRNACMGKTAQRGGERRCACKEDIAKNATYQESATRNVSSLSQHQSYVNSRWTREMERGRWCLRKGAGEVDVKDPKVSHMSMAVTKVSVDGEATGVRGGELLTKCDLRADGRGLKSPEELGLS